MKIMVFTEGTLFIGPEDVLLSREERIRAVQQVLAANEPIDFRSSVPVGNAVQKLRAWHRQGAEIVYLTSRSELEEINDIRYLLDKFDFPQGELFFRGKGEAYRDVAERVLPDILVEDDCESIGGEIEMTYPHIRPEFQVRIKSVVVPEAGGIDHLPDNLSALVVF